MPDRTNAEAYREGRILQAGHEGGRTFSENEPLSGPASPAAPLDTPKTYPVAFPLDEFYIRSGRQLPEVERIDASYLPAPYRSLLAHNNDMTPTLSAYHARLIHLRVLSRAQRDAFYFREVVLVADESEQPVEFGAIRINLALCPPALRRHIVDERVPLGHLLRVHSIPHSSRPKAFFRLTADALMVEALQLPGPCVLYGRRNTLLNASGRALAEVVEILPPLSKSPAGYYSNTQQGEP